MSTDQSGDRIADALGGPLATLGLDVEAVELSRAGKRRVLRVAVDQDGGVTLDDIAAATREVSRTLDAPEASALMGAQPYTLEVSSPGTDRPLALPRHWRRNRGRLVAVSLREGGGVTGRITDSDERRAVLDVDGAVHEVDYAAVAVARIQVELTRGRERTDHSPQG